MVRHISSDPNGGYQSSMRFRRSKLCGGYALSAQGKEPVKEPAVRGTLRYSRKRSVLRP